MIDARGGMPPAIFLAASLVAALGVGAWFFLAKTPERLGRDGVAIHPSVSQNCKECHEAIHAAWKPSHHAWANRPFDPAIDGAAFDPPQTFTTGSVTSTAGVEGGRHTLRTLGPGGTVEPFLPDMVLAHTPLRQMLIPFPGGRWQATELALDPSRNEWFNVYGEENRRADEWGAWMNRGMNWNANCAFCHMTGFQKNYDIPSDSYRSTWTEMGVSCAQCHGPMPGHAEAYRAAASGAGAASPPPPATARLTPVQIMHNCAACHSRREELTGDFRPGEAYADHFRLTLPENPMTYYPDGQIRDEVFVYGSFRLSKMGQKGLTCANCHDPHSGKTILPVADNTLCMSCHQPGALDAPVIDPVAHGHHAPGSEGNSCVGCHMPHTTYMQRDPRRDHGFLVPDPLLTKELGIPNACQRCHADQTADWAADWADRWYGEKLERPERRRTRAIARVQRGDATALPDLLAVAREETNPFWRATLISLMAPWTPGDSGVRVFAEAALADPEPDVRAAAVRALRTIPEARDKLVPLLDDPVRLVRLDAAEALRGNLGGRDKNRAELVAYLDNMSDQPGGAARQGQLAFAEGRHSEALAWYRKALSWDKYSVPIYSDLALIQSAGGDAAEAARTLAEGRASIPSDPELPFLHGMALAEASDLPGAEKAFASAAALRPGFARAWYNLGLLKAGQERLEESAADLARAMREDPANPDYPYAAATVAARREKPDEARKLLLETLAIDPHHPGAQQMLRSLGP